MEINIPNLDSLPAAAARFIEAIGSHRVVAFDAPMGAGKTTLIAEICHQLGVTDTVNSPSFSIINEYTDSVGEKIFHFDFYRLKSISEAIEIGTEDYLYSGKLCLIEWPGRVEEMLPDNTIFANITVNSDGSRTISL